jgi:hypothetical protein
VIVVAALVLPRAFDEPLRRRLEDTMNAQLNGYTAHLGGAAFRPWGFTVELRDLSLVQNARPEPPVARFPRLRVSVQWRALLSRAIVADVLFVDPAITIDRRQAETEARDNVPVSERGWQRALESIYPLKINRLEVRNGEVIYADQGPFKPVYLTSLAIEADNIRNVRSKEGVYPSPLRLHGILHGSAPIRFDGRADFLAEPQAALTGDFALRSLSLRYLDALLDLYHIDVQRGTLGATGKLTYTADQRVIEVASADLDGVNADYLYGRQDQAPETPGTSESPIVVRADRVRLTGGNLGVRNVATAPEYRVFVQDASVAIDNFSSAAADQRTSRLRVRGRFMGSGDAAVDVTVRRTQPSPDFDLAVRIDNTELTTMNQVLQAHGGFDVAGGTFAFYCELAVHDGRVDGYVKPVFVDVDVYDSQKDAGKSTLQKAYEGVIAALATVFRNQPHNQIATRADLSGPLDDPKASILQISLQLVRNAFIKAIVPGLESKNVG